MKLKNIFLASVALVAMMLTSCSDEFEALMNSSIKVSSSYVAIPVGGGSTEISLETNGDYEIVGAPSWLTITPTSGAAGLTTIAFSAEAYDAGRSTEDVMIKTANDSLRINVIQGLSTVATATCAEVINGIDNKTYRVTGTCTSIANTSYGNFYMNDGTGELYVYGTVDGSGAYNWAKFDIEIGDEVTVEGPKVTYNGTVELKDATFISVSKSLIKVDSLTVDGVKCSELPIEGGEIVAHLTNKGAALNVEVPEDAADWISLKSVKGNEVTFKVAANDGGDRSTTLEFSTASNGKTYTAQAEMTQAGAIAQVTCAEFNAQADGTAQYKVHGIITSIASTKYGNLYINDGTGEVYVYGTTDFASYDLKVGDEVVLQSVHASYKGAAQMKNAVVVEKTAHDVKTVAELKELADDKNTYYLVTGTVCHAEESSAKFDLDTYGNFGLKDETGTIYVYGVADGLDGVTKNFSATGVQEGDNITILAYKTSYKETIEIVGKFIKKN